LTAPGREQESATASTALELQRRAAEMQAELLAVKTDMQQAAGAAVEHQRRAEVLQVQLDEALAAAAADARAASDAHAMAAELEAEIEVLRGRESDARSSAEAARLQAASMLCQLAAEVQVWHVSYACARDRTPCGLGR